eukprot:3865354-Alexandrium_andersonii.AAC.1
MAPRRPSQGARSKALDRSTSAPAAEAEESQCKVASRTLLCLREHHCDTTGGGKQSSMER